MFTTYGTRDGVPNDHVRAVTGDAAGNVWVLSGDRIVQWDGARFHPVTPQGLTLHEWPLMINRLLLRFSLLPGHDRPVALNAVIEDREGNIWLGADGQGLLRIRQPRVKVYSRAQGLLAQNVYPVLTDRSGSVWMGVWPSGVTRITNGRAVNYTVADGLASGFITSLTEDRQGRVWVASHHDVNGGLRVFENGRFREVGQTLVPPRTFVHAMLHDAAGALWLGTHVGLVRYRGGVATMFTTKTGSRRTT